ncbi:Gfo/Idh/MocA family protein [Paenibacillus cremeus]|nr:Gfo/Idh/MocA family oxidoreductase [Paenibacillus cremeus]
MTIRMLTSALIGAGNIARSLHIPAHSRLQRSKLKWVCDTDLEAARQVAEKNGIPHHTDKLEDVLNDLEVDWVDITTPNASHEPIALQSFQAGKHVFVQKPMAGTIDAAERMIAASRTYDRKLGVFMFLRGDGGIETLRNLIEHGHLGKVITLRGRMISYKGFSLDDDSWRKQEARGALEQLGTHLIDLFLHLQGEIKWVQSYSDTIYAPMKADDVTTAIYGFEGGVSAVLETTYCQFTNRRTVGSILEVNGTAGNVRYNYRTGEMSIQLENDCELGDFRYNKEEGVAQRTFESSYRGCVHRVHESFVESLCDGTPLLIDGPTGLYALKIIEKTFESAREERRLPVDAPVR